MTTAELLSLMSSLQIRLWAEGDRLRFSAPPGALTPDLRAELSARKAELLDLLRMAPPSAHGTATQSEPRPERLPLSFAQERVWFIHQIDPDSTAYTIPGAIRLRGQLDLDALERSFGEIVRRHEILRTTFPTVEGQPVQQIGPAQPVTLRPVIDLSRMRPEEQGAAVQRHVLAEAAQPFDLERGPLLRISLLRLSDAEHVLTLMMDHSISDLWSLGVLMRELSALYLAFNGLTPSVTLPELPIQYADWSIRQRRALEGAALAEHLAYWRQQLAGAPADLDLPFDRPRQATQTFAGDRLPVALPSQIVQPLHRLSQDHKATLFMTLLAAFQVVLARYTRQDDLLVGTSIANRHRAETAGLIGFLINTLVLRTDLSGDPSFRGLLERVRRMLLDAYAHQDLPFEKLVQELQPERNLSRNPLFQVMFELHHAPAVRLELPGLQLQELEIERRTAQFDLNLHLGERSDGLVGYIEYDTQLFNRSTIERLRGHLETVLQSIAADPDRPISRLTLLTPAEQQRQLYDWNTTSWTYPPAASLHQLFEAQVDRTPEALALVYSAGDGATAALEQSYRQLDQAANQQAHLLRALGVGPGTLVGLCLHRSVEMLAGMLGIFKAGGVFLPLDPAYPAQRLSYMLQNSGATILLVHDATLPIACSLAQESQRIDVLLCLDQTPRPDALPATVQFYTAAELAAYPLTRCAPLTQPHDLAYIMYTSGSTGRPKGVPITHGNLVPFFLNNQRFFAFQPHDRIIQYHSLSFDFSTWEIFEAWLAGASLHVVAESIARDVSALAEYLSSAQITVLNMTPSQFSVLLEYVRQALPQALASLRTIVLGGEALPSSLARQALELVTPDCRLYNEYGPTEATISCSIFQFTSATLTERADLATIPIGQPIANMQLYVLDNGWQLAPVGVPGELYIGGTGLAREYYRLPTLTAERFIPHPFADAGSIAAGSRLYRTGDLVRYLEDGNIEFLGRTDHQVKLRGYRIELGEIEAVLADHPAVREAVAVIRQDSAAAGNPVQRLVAYIVRADRAAASAAPVDQPLSAELHRFLQERLPDYQIPAAIVELDALPLTANGKLDRQGLPAPQVGAIQVAVTAPPRTPTEEILAAIWSDLLGVASIGVYDYVLALGGHSLRITRIGTRLRERFGINLPLRTLFEEPTIAGLASRIDALRPEQPSLPDMTIQPADRAAPLPLSYAQLSLWRQDRLRPGNPAYNDMFAAQISGALDIDALQHSLAALVQRHEALRTIFPVVDGEPVQQVTPAAAVPLWLDDQSSVAPAAWERSAEQAALDELAQPFALDRGPLLRGRLIRFSPTDHVLLLPYHRIVMDRWSTTIFRQELLALYQAAVAAHAAELVALPVTYADYAVWQRRWLQGPALQPLLDYWQQALTGLPTAPLVPPSRPQPAAPSYRGTRLPLRFPNEQAQALRVLSNQLDVTVFMTLVTAFKVALHSLTGQTDLTVGAGVANRTHGAVEQVIGSFANTILLRTSLAHNPRFSDLLQHMRTTMLNAYAHQALPFELLSERLQAEGRSEPLFQVMVVYQHLSLADLDQPNMRLQPLSLARDTTRYDVILSIQDDQRGLSGSLGYNIDLFDEDVIRRLAERFQAVLAAIVRDPDLPIAAYLAAELSAGAAG